jgi:hypothetical protein
MKKLEKVLGEATTVQDFKNIIDETKKDLIRAEISLGKGTNLAPKDLGEIAQALQVELEVSSNRLKNFF